MQAILILGNLAGVLLALVYRQQQKQLKRKEGTIKTQSEFIMQQGSIITKLRDELAPWQRRFEQPLKDSLHSFMAERNIHPNMYDDCLQCAEWGYNTATRANQDIVKQRNNLLDKITEIQKAQHE